MIKWIEDKCNVWTLLLVTFILMFFLPFLFGEGMFFDGITYAAISRNLANGKGTFWNLYYTDLVFPIFTEHPPLFFWIQSTFFYFFGDSYLIEKFWSVGLLCILLFIIKKVAYTNTTFKEKHDIRITFFLGFTMSTINYWGNVNLLDNLLSIFCLLSIWMQILMLQSKNKKQTILYFLLSTICTICALMTKGFIAFFPLAFCFWYWIVYRNIKFKKIFLYIFLQIFIILMFIALLLQNKNASIYFTNYIHQQVIASLTGQRISGIESYLGHFSIWLSIAKDILLFPTIILILFLFIKKSSIQIKNNKEALLWFLVGLSASLPIAISYKQASFYFVSSAPYFVLGFGYLINKNILPSYFKYQLWVKLFLFLVIISITVFSISLINKPLRDKDLITDLKTLLTIIPKYNCVTLSPTLQTNWVSVAYLERYNEYKFTCTVSKFMLYDKNEKIIIDNKPKDTLFLNAYTLIIYK
ncbi:MAG: ArnT family glycosyltransferase [Chitinophagaceae bacterium]